MTNEEAVKWLENLKDDLRETRVSHLWHYDQTLDEIIAILRNQPEWIPFETRELDAQEKEEHPEWDYVLCEPLPDDGQKILVNVKKAGHEQVQMDEFYTDCDGCYLDSGYEIESEVTAWQPLPGPYKGGNPK